MKLNENCLCWKLNAAFLCKTPYSKLGMEWCWKISTNSYENSSTISEIISMIVSNDVNVSDNRMCTHCTICQFLCNFTMIFIVWRKCARCVETDREWEDLFLCTSCMFACRRVCFPELNDTMHPQPHPHTRPDAHNHPHQERSSKFQKNVKNRRSKNKTEEHVHPVVSQMIKHEVEKTGTYSQPFKMLFV